LRAPNLRRIQLKMLVSSFACCRHLVASCDTDYHCMYII
jgi:hypothetical protein